MRKVSAEEIKDNIIRYGLPEDATDDVKEVAKQMEKKRLLLRKKSNTTIEDDNLSHSIKDSHFVGCLFDVINIENYFSDSIDRTAIMTSALLPNL